jgi:hypothetical protein
LSQIQATMKNIIFLLITMCFFYEVKAQTNVCGTSPLSKEQYNKLKLISTETQSSKDFRMPGVVRNVTLNINIMVYPDGPITSIADVQMQVDSANYYFANAGIEFTICNVNLVPYTHNWFGWDINYENQIGAVYDLPGCLNIYYVDYIPNASAYAYYAMPYSPDRIIMGQRLSGEIFAHELGHSFNLIHTHGDVLSPYGTEEWVNGNNCATTGDLICDTPADPNLYVNRVDTLCNYIDTTSADSLGFLFVPDTRNIMSYTPFKCYEHFTQGQYDRIAYTMTHARAYLKSGEHVAASITAPASACIYDAPITLTANPPGGTFSGIGITGNQFDPAAAGPGMHVITYTPTVAASNPESTDQYYSYSDTAYNTASAWQSFTAAIAENLVAFSFSIKSSAAQPVIATLYDGTGVSGTVLSRDTIQIDADSLFNWKKLILQQPVHLNSGSDYTFEIVTTAGNIEMAGNRYNVYSSGTTDKTNDLSFITHVLTDLPFCGNGVQHMINVSAPPAPVITNLYPVYCIDAPAQPVNGSPGGGISIINGDTAAVIDPSALGTGQHSLYYIYTNNFGCSNDSTFTFTVNDTTAITPVIPSLICTADPVINLSGLPAGGNFYMDGQLMLTTQIDPGVLSGGVHAISYTYEATYPWIDTVDQDNYFASSNASYSLGFGQTAWQSFTAGQDGYLNQVDFGVYVSDTTTFNYKIYKGEGTAGQLLYSNAFQASNNSTNQREFPVPPFQFFLEKDSMYTFELGMNPTVNNTIAYNDSVYTSGNCHLAFIGLPESDFKFQTHINSVYQCGLDSVVSQFIISASPVVNLGNDTSIAFGQMILLDAGNPGCTYQWSTGAVSQSFFVAGNIIVTVTVTNADGCSATDTIQISVISGIEELQSAFSIAPNPVNDQLKISADHFIEGIIIVNALGQPVYNWHNPIQDKKTFTVNTSQLTEGVYLVKVLMNGAWSSRKIIEVKN